ncbi:class I SAM-dependent methyltransferase [Streptomyces sp. NPDC051578]|uniref:class I SAM-dependent methyltransferase n=1 Tax=Streptomyces sp. NPDC051578 TaxID=3365662 RepID=UPI00378C82C3
MNPPLYQRVNEVLEAVGGHWTKSAEAHLFPADAACAIAPVLASGQVVTLREKRQDAQYFPTPAAVVKRLVELAAVAPGMHVLEPSAGSGAVASAAAAAGAVVDCIERDPGYAAALTEAGTARTIRVADFLTATPEPLYDRVLMNPPFTKGADMAHVQHALRFLKPTGLLVAVMSCAVTHDSRGTAEFRALVEQRGGAVEAVPEKAFASSGTNVDTVIVTIPATRPTDAQPAVWPTREVPEQAMAEFRDPAEIAREIADSLCEAMQLMDKVARDLAKPNRIATPVRPVADLPLWSGGEQLAFIDLGEAS